MRFDVIKGTGAGVQCGIPLFYFFFFFSSLSPFTVIAFSQLKSCRHMTIASLMLGCRLTGIDGLVFLESKSCTNFKKKNKKHLAKAKLLLTLFQV